MGLETAAIAALGAGAMGGIGGAVKGGKGTPDQVTRENSTQQTKFDPATGTEKQLQDSSLQNFLKQEQLAGEFEGSIGDAQGIQDQSQNLISQILSGQALAPTEAELNNVNNLRSTLVAQGSDDISRLLDQKLGQINQSAGVRGLRGQAVSQLQGDVLRGGAEQMGNLVQQANSMAAQELMEAPYRRINAQGGFAQTGMNFADMLRQQSQINRMNLQNPALFEALRGERLAGGRTTSNTTTVNPGQQGGFWNGVGGAFAGAAGGLNAGVNTASTFVDLSKKLRGG